MPALPDSLRDRRFIYAGGRHCVTRNVDAPPREVLTNVLPEVRQLQCAARLIGKRESFRIAIAACIQHQSPDRVGGITAIRQNTLHRCIPRDRLILPEGGQQIIEWLFRNITHADRLSQRNEDRVSRLASIAGIELLLPQRQAAPKPAPGLLLRRPGRLKYGSRHRCCESADAGASAEAKRRRGSSHSAILPVHGNTAAPPPM